MARDFENIHDIDDLGDNELRELVRAQLADNDSIDSDDIKVHVEKGRVRLLGRVGTEGEMRVAEHVVTDGLGLTDVSNELIVDATRRAESPMAIDEHLEEEEETDGLLLGDRPASITDETWHLADRVDADEALDERLFGTTDVQSAIADGTPWNPPTSPTPEGVSSEMTADDR